MLTSDDVISNTQDYIEELMRGNNDDIVELIAKSDLGFNLSINDAYIDKLLDDLKEDEKEVVFSHSRPKGGKSITD